MATEMDDKGNIVLRNRRICDYYQRNPHISAEAVNLVVLDLFEALGRDLTASLTNTTLADLARSVRELHTGLPARLHESNQMFLDNVKMIVSMATGENAERVMIALQRTTDTHVEQLKAHLPKVSGADEVLAVVRAELQGQLAAGAEVSAGALEAKVTSSLQPLYTFFATNQEHLTARLDGLKEEATVTRTASAKAATELGEFLAKYKASSQFKGQCSENELSTLLNQTWPMAEVMNTTATKASGDFIMRRDGYDDVMIENKNYEANVNIDETKKFIRDATGLGMHAIMLSQRSGIASKPNFFVEFNGTRVLVYVHNVEYSAEKVKMAVDLVDSLGARLQEVAMMQQEDGEGCTMITAECLGNIQAEYSRFVQQKDDMMVKLRDSHKAALSMLDAMRLPELSTLLNKKFASASNEQHICQICKLAFGSKRSLASHLKKHKAAGEVESP